MKRANLFAKLPGKLLWFCLALIISAGILWWIAPSSGLAATFGFGYDANNLSYETNYGTINNPGSNTNYGTVNSFDFKAPVYQVTTVTPKKIKDACQLKKCTQPSDCLFYGCQAGSKTTPDKKVTYLGDCVNGTCVCTNTIKSEPQSCPVDIPRCFNEDPETPSSCGECNDFLDCTKRDDKCKDGDVYQSQPICNLHTCFYQEIIKEDCKNGCLVINGKAKCVACDDDSKCSARKDYCSPFRDTITKYNGFCNQKRGLCENKEALVTDCRKQGKYCAFSKPELGCVECRNNTNCSSKAPTKKCTDDRKGYQRYSSSCDLTSYTCIEKKNGGPQSCPTDKPTCIDGECFECQSNYDCSYKLPKTECTKDLSGYNLFTMDKAVCNDLNKCEFNSKLVACEKSGDNQPTYCKNGSPLPSCVQCLADSHCAYQGKSAECDNDTLITYTPGCVGNNCNKEASFIKEDCAKKGLSCLADFGRCGCSLDSQCEAERPAMAHKQPKCNDDGKSYTYFEARCNGANGFCAYDPIVTTCEGNKVCHDFADGARCINCSSDTDCSILKKDPKYSSTCKNGQVTTYTSFTCAKPDPSDPGQNYCAIASKTNPCKNGCYSDSKGISRCLDCATNKDCTYPLSNYCDAKNTKLGYNYVASGTCTRGKCVYRKSTYYCLRNSFTNCLDDNTLATYGKAYCKNTDGKLGCAQDVVSTEPCLGCFYAKKNNLKCRK